jgi:benzoate-CoA ligase
MQEGDVGLSVAKLFFGYATGTNLMFPFSVGASAVLFRDRATPERIFELCARHSPTVLTSVPTMINKMLQDGGTREIGSLRVCISAGEALPEELYHRWKSRFGVEILDGIGSAELFHIYISNRFGEVVPGSLGRVVPGYEARIADPEGRDLPEGETGTLWVRGGSTALCYWQDGDRSRETFRGAWCVTGDQFRRDAGGLFWYEGRTDDMLKVSGIFVSPLEIEDCLYRHAAVRDVCVVGAADREGLTRPRAYVTLKEGTLPSVALARELKDLAKRSLSPYKYPRWICFVEDLPRSDRGKVQRKRIREGYEVKPIHEEIDVGGRE